jgi:8-oxo-dGTP pyrophosphatase MutT (NUDIX family)
MQSRLGAVDPVEPVRTDGPTGGGATAVVSWATGGGMKIRRGARVVVIDDSGRVLLLRHEEPSVAAHPQNRTGAPFLWVTPGGGVEKGESFEDGARRELREEIGLAEVELGPCVWTARFETELFWGPTLVDERFFVLRVPVVEVEPFVLEGAAGSSYRGHRWWRAEEVLASDELFFPIGLGELLVPLVAGEQPARPIRIERH